MVDHMEVVGAEAVSQGARMAEAEYLMVLGVTGMMLATEGRKGGKGNQRQCSSHSHRPLLLYFFPARRHCQA